jgi:hypothetical protein
MISLSLNVRGLGSPSKRISSVRLVEIHRPDVLMIEETMGESHKLVKELGKFFKDYDFRSLYVVGNS